MWLKTYPLKVFPRNNSPAALVKVHSGCMIPRCSMRLAYLPTKLGSFGSKCRVDIPYIEHQGGTVKDGNCTVHVVPVNICFQIGGKAFMAKGATKNTMQTNTMQTNIMLKCYKTCRLAFIELSHLTIHKNKCMISLRNKCLCILCTCACECDLL